jgi:oxygen-independent coproporphyrinogen-3 oxidase
MYWRNDEYLGFGAAAHSYIQDRRYWNASEVIAYIVKSVETVEGDVLYPATVVGEETLNTPARMGETIMMNLRMLDGIDLDAFEARFGVRLESVYAETLPSLLENELLEITEHHLRLTQRGLYVSNSVFQEFLSP